MKPLTIGKIITDRQDASLSSYFRDVSKIPLLRAEDERELSDRIKQGDEQAIEKLVTSNLRFAISVAKQYQGKGLPLVDLIQEANMGLVQSAKLFDADRGVKFISFAVWHMRQNIIKALSDNSRTVRVPTSQIVEISKLNKLVNDFEQQNYRKPSIEELALENEQLLAAINAYGKAVSLDSIFNEDCCLLDILPNENSEYSDKNLINTDVAKKLDTLISELSHREQDVIRMSYGIGMFQMQNEEIANRFGITEERVRQIREGALERLRENPEIKQLI